jgi:indolepyruvate ferredoxin oxidoreductase
MLLARLGSAPIETLAAIAAAPMDMRGYGPVKDEAVTAAKARVAAKLAALDEETDRHAA